MKASILLLVMAAFAGPAFAADAAPAAAGAATPTGVAPGDNGPDLGLTIIGDKETPLGLYIIPWKNAYADTSAGRPVQLLDAEPTAVDRREFRRQIDYYHDVNDYRQSLLNSHP